MQSQRWTPLPPGLRMLRWDRLGVFSYTKILLILFFKKRLFYPTWPGSILEKRVAETSKPASRKQFLLQKTIASKTPTPAVNVEIAALISDLILNFAFPRNIDAGVREFRGPTCKSKESFGGHPWKPLPAPCYLIFFGKIQLKMEPDLRTKWLALARPYGGRVG